ncbi:hypothetical protein LCGC14_0384820 [marine sediment metagenome]|uniref:Uncharacterized protein n=1 Tax=marine sediment metagenome TaxID=412755 RepID=A0A0F9T148_9ZZZZ
MKDRRNWLKGKISELENKELFVELDETDKIFLDGYKTELKMIELEERGLLKGDDFKK